MNGTGATQGVRMDVETKQWLLAASRRAPQRYPGAVGEVLRQELQSSLEEPRSS